MGKGRGEEGTAAVPRAGWRSPEERWAPIFATRAVSGARDTPPRVNCRTSVRQINIPVGLRTGMSSLAR